MVKAGALEEEFDSRYDAAYDVVNSATEMYADEFLAWLYAWPNTSESLTIDDETWTVVE